MTAGTAVALLPFALAIGIWVSWSDMKFMKIPNNAVIALLLVWLLVAPLTILIAGLPAMDWLWGWALAAVVLTVGFVSNALRLVGAGDAKFAAAMAPFFVGSDLRIVMALFAACLLGAFTAHRVVRLIGPFRSATADWASWTHKDFPMGLALSGTLVFHLLLTIQGAF
ncbi:MAG: prepilin peptidase [Rhodobacteraceae bacterium]|nr:prepilin peptidase [Paracoccaceae bacterium]MCF8515024.1 prepilin peptidase [Paracoccaceae bacterium]MCF8519267.1 prepilin peptidase [Paracoccaceae bacterium]